MRVRRFLRDRGLSLTMLALFACFFTAQALSGWRHENEERRQHGWSELRLGGYVRSGAFIESVAENWESEFLQMAAFVVLTSILFQRGSAESNDPDAKVEEATSPETGQPPWPVRRGGIPFRLYRHSLSLALGGLFLVSFALHAFGGAAANDEREIMHGRPAPGVVSYLGSSTFWFEPLQNWQSEFLSVGVLVILSVFLREAGSSQSKPVTAPHAQTGV
jgi:hypothetical protein